MRPERRPARISSWFHSSQRTAMSGWSFSKPCSSPGITNGASVRKQPTAISPLRPSPQRAGARLEFARMREQAARLDQHALARRRQGQPLGMVADEELDAEILLDLGDRRGDRGLRHAELARGLRDAAGLGGGDEIAEGADGELLHRIFPIQFAAKYYFTDDKPSPYDLTARQRPVTRKPHAPYRQRLSPRPARRARGLDGRRARQGRHHPQGLQAHRRRARAHVRHGARGALCRDDGLSRRQRPQFDPAEAARRAEGLVGQVATRSTR